MSKVITLFENDIGQRSWTHPQVALQRAAAVSLRCHCYQNGRLRKWFGLKKIPRRRKTFGMMMVKKSYHTSASLGLPQAWTSTKMTRPYFDPVLKSKQFINYSHTLNLTSSILTIDLKPGERKLGCIPYSQPHAWRPVKTNEIKMFWETLKHTTSKWKCLWVGHNSMRSKPGEVLARVFHCEQSDPNQWRHICGKSIKVLWAKSEIGFATDKIVLFDEAETNLSPSKSSVDGGGRQRGASLAGAGRGSFSRAGGQL